LQWSNANTQLAQHGGQRQRTITPPPTSAIFYFTILSLDKKYALNYLINDSNVLTNERFYIICWQKWPFLDKTVSVALEKIVIHKHN